MTYLCYFLHALLHTCIFHAALLRVSPLAPLLCPALLQLSFTFYFEISSYVVAQLSFALNLSSQVI